jgi:hypothetical protein
MRRLKQKSLDRNERFPPARQLRLPFAVYDQRRTHDPVPESLVRQQLRQLSKIHTNFPSTFTGRLIGMEFFRTRSRHDGLTPDRQITGRDLLGPEIEAAGFVFGHDDAPIEPLRQLNMIGAAIPHAP